MMQRGVDNFFGQIASVEEAYTHNSFSYFAARSKDGFTIIKAALLLHPGETNVPATHFKSKNVRAGNYPLRDLGVDARQLVEQILSGKIETPDGPLLFPPRKDGSYSAIFDPLHPIGLQNRQRFLMLTISGADRTRIRETHLDWELKAHERPYFNLNDLAAEYLLAPLNDTRKEATVEVIAYGIAGIDQASRIDGTTATVMVRLLNPLEREKLDLGYRVLGPRGVVERKIIRGTELEWSEADGTVQIGKTIITVPDAAVLDCVVSYAGVARNHLWVLDPSKAQNPRRAAYEAVDPDLKIFTDYINKVGKNSPDQNNFESAIAWLLWMLGFSPAHLGSSKQLASADLVVTTPRGDFAVVECTTGLLKSEHKLPHLIERFEAIKARVGSLHRVIPVIVTSRTRAEVRAELPDAEKLGVLVITRENLDEANVRTLLMPNADALFDDAEKAIRSAQAKHEVQEELSLES